MSRKKLSFIDLFAGAGGLSLGLEEAGFNPVFVNELNPDAMESYLINRRDKFPYLDEFNEFDIKTLASANYINRLKNRLKSTHGIDCDNNDLDLIAGGPPCQGFSGIGHRRSYSVAKDQLPSNFLYEDMIYVIKKLKPKLFLFENVRGIKHFENWQGIYKAFSDIKNYHVTTDLIHSKNYGAPQNRPRIFIVGVHKDLGKAPDDFDILPAGGFLPPISNDYPNICDLLDDLVDDEYINGGETINYPKPAKTNQQRLLRHNPLTGKPYRKGEELSEHKYTKHSENIIKKFKYMIENNGQIKDSHKTNKFAQRLLPKTWNESGPSITITSLPDDFVHHCQPRILTVREWARLQTFPDWYQFFGKRTTGGIRRAGNPREKDFDRELPKYTQIGNAVPVVVAKNIANHFRRRLLV